MSPNDRPGWTPLGSGRSLTNEDLAAMKFGPVQQNITPEQFMEIERRLESDGE